MPAYSLGPWIAERLSRGFIHILSQPDANGARDVVALVNGGTHAEANAALICAAPEMAAAIEANDYPSTRLALVSRGLLEIAVVASLGFVIGWAWVSA